MEHNPPSIGDLAYSSSNENRQLIKALCKKIGINFDELERERYQGSANTVNSFDKLLKEAYDSRITDIINNAQ